MRRRRVVQICGATDGAQWMVDLSAGLCERGYDVTAIIAGADGDTARRLEQAGVPYEVSSQNLTSESRIVEMVARIPRIGVRLSLLVHAAALLRRALSLALVLRRLEAEITHAQIFNSIILGRLAAYVARVPVRISMVPGPWHLEVPTFRRMDIRTQWMDTVLVGGSQRITDLYREAGVPPRRTRTIPYCGDAAKFDPALADGRRFRKALGLDPDVPLVGQVAHFYPIVAAPYAPPLAAGRGLKGHEDLVEAASIVLRTRPDVRFVLVGGGWEAAGEVHKQQIEERCRELEIDGQVIFTGRRDDIPDALAAFDVSVQCSLNENYGGTIESLLMQRPTVATRVGAMPETVREEETGLLVEPRDPPALAAAIMRLLADPTLAEKLGRRGRELMLEHYTTEAMTEAVAQLYEELLGRRPPSPARMRFYNESLLKRPPAGK
ncbi:MAG TPA: glycosyltransferase [Gaiellaceae bacterium]|nr:glycosyltransferase [Gaiellaceae bacterium]